MRSFASDNNSGVHPDIMQAIFNANTNHAIGYGDDCWTAKAVEVIKEQFGESASPFFVFNGTGANCVALQAATRSFNSVITATGGHIEVDECGAPTKMTGCHIISIPTTDGKLTPELIAPKLTGFGECHHSQPKVVYISQSTEVGTVYTPQEIKAIADLIHGYGMYLHMDGARLANACATLGCSMKACTVDAGVDILSLGGTKNGMMMGEVVIAFKPELAVDLAFIRKQSAQLASKMRYLTAQFEAYFNNSLWLANATRANKQALRLKEALSEFEDFSFEYPVQANALFVSMPECIIEKLREHFFFYTWDEARNVVRFVCSWDTTDEDIEAFIAIVKQNVTQ